jgi:hypothetical protein
LGGTTAIVAVAGVVAVVGMNGDFSDKRGGGGTHRGWEIGTVGWGVQGHFRSAKADEEVQVATSAVSSGNGMVRNEKGRGASVGLNSICLFVCLLGGFLG